MTKVTEQEMNDFNVLNNEFTKYFEVIYLENNDLTKLGIDSFDLSDIKLVHFPMDSFAEKEEHVDRKISQVEKMANLVIKTAMKQALVEGTVYAPNGTVKLDYYAEHPQSILSSEEKAKLEGKVVANQIKEQLNKAFADARLNYPESR